jgi:hypothetical protein
MQAADADAMITNQVMVLGYIIDRAKLNVDIAAVSDTRWYTVAEWGFNVGRADCTNYLNNLFILARQKARTNGLLLDLSAAATAIVTATSPHSVALSIIAPAFGLAGNVSNRVFDSYLFSDSSPGIIQSKVKDLQDAYKNNTWDHRDQVTTSAAAYAAIQGYYNICLPESIEGVLLEKIATSKAVVADAGGTPKPPVVRGAVARATVRTFSAPRTMTPKVFLD